MQTRYMMGRCQHPRILLSRILMVGLVLLLSSISPAALAAHRLFVVSGAIAPHPLAAHPQHCPEGMVAIPKGTFRIGANGQLPEERSAEGVTVSGFCMDTHEVTNAQFAEFVEATGYVTVAERPLPVEQFPDVPDDQRQPGSVVFQRVPTGQVIQELSGWHWIPGANWQHPEGSERVFEKSVSQVKKQKSSLSIKLPIV